RSTVPRRRPRGTRPRPHHRTHGRLHPVRGTPSRRGGRPVPPVPVPVLPRLRLRRAARHGREAPHAPAATGPLLAADRQEPGPRAQVAPGAPPYARSVSRATLAHRRVGT